VTGLASLPFDAGAGVIALIGFDPFFQIHVIVTAQALVVR
jgi:hypothetical protein